MKTYIKAIALSLFTICIASTSQAQIINTIAGTAPYGYSGDGGPALSAKLNHAYSIATDPSGNVFFTDSYNNRIRKITKSTGIITTIAGTGVAGFSGDGGLATAAQLNTPTGVAIDATGNVYITDSYNNRVRMVNASSGFITTVVGTGANANTGDGGPAVSAAIWGPQSLAFDPLGNLYVLCNYVRKVDLSTGIITAVQTSNSSMLPNYSDALAVDGSGTIYVSSSSNSTVYKIAPGTGLVSAFAGSGNGGTYGYSGDGGLATAALLYFPYGMVVDFQGNLYIADETNNRVRKVNASTGIITTVAGTGVYADNGDGGLATSAALSHPHGIALDNSGNMFVSDSSFSIREIGSLAGISEENISSMVSVYPVPGNGQLTVKLNGSGYTLVNIYDITGKLVHQETLEASAQNHTLYIQLEVADGTYLMQVIKGNDTINKKLVIRR